MESAILNHNLFSASPRRYYESLLKYYPAIEAYIQESGDSRRIFAFVTICYFKNRLLYVSFGSMWHDFMEPLYGDIEVYLSHHPQKPLTARRRALRRQKLTHPARNNMEIFLNYFVKYSEIHPLDTVNIEYASEEFIKECDSFKNAGIKFTEDLQNTISAATTNLAYHSDLSEFAPLAYEVIVNQQNNHPRLPFSIHEEKLDVPLGQKLSQENLDKLLYYESFFDDLAKASGNEFVFRGIRVDNVDDIISDIRGVTTFATPSLGTAFAYGTKNHYQERKRRAGVLMIIKLYPGMPIITTQMDRLYEILLPLRSKLIPTEELKVLVSNTAPLLWIQKFELIK